MRKLSLFIVSLLLLTFLGTAVLAQEADLPDPGTTPDSAFYFLKTWKEGIQTFFTPGAENKAKQFLHLSEVRLAEYNKMIEKGKTEIAQRTLDKYEKQLGRALEKAEKAKEKGKDVEELVTLVKEKTAKQQEALSRVLEKAPEQAKKGIEKAVEASKKGHQKAIEAVSKVKEEKVETEEVKEVEEAGEDVGGGKAKGKGKK